jgi:hypothetical protein
MSNYHPILKNIATDIRENIRSSKITKAKVTDRFQESRRRHVGNSKACNKMDTYHSISMKNGTQTKKNMLSSKVAKAEAYGIKRA